MAELGKKVLLIDLDSQGNLSQILGVNKFKYTMYDCLIKNIHLQDAIIETEFGVHIVPSDLDLSNATIELLLIL
jgi:chromosome partitioning protein